MALSLRRRARSTSEGDRGAAAVEAALILPVFFAMIFGIIDFSLALRDANSVSNAARAAGRSASALPKEVMTVSEPKFNTTTSDNVNAAVIVGLKSAMTNLSGLPASSIQDIWFYQASADGTPANATSITGGVCTTTCVRYRYNSALTWTDTSVTPNAVVTGGFSRVSGSWPATAINACQASTSSVGVYLRVRRTYLFPFTQWVARSNTIDLSDSAVFRFEPKPTSAGQTCTNTT